MLVCSQQEHNLFGFSEVCPASVFPVLNYLRFSVNINEATPLSAINTQQGLSKPLDSLVRLGAPMSIIRQSVSLGNGCESQHPQTMQGGAE